MLKKYLLLLLLPVIAYSCKNTKDIVEAPKVYNLDTIVVKPMHEGYRATVTKEFQLIHTDLDVKFDYEKQFLYGKANVTLKPWFYATDSLVLDAKGFDIHKVALKEGDKLLDLKYSYDTLQIHIELPKTYTRQDTLTIFVDYTSMPNKLAEGGSAAISSDKGLYFINPLKNEPGKPVQIWTQGETEASSCWFPTIDKPNQKTTQEIKMTVDSGLVTLSNGLLIGSTNNGDGTRTDHWKQTLPHAPYLFMMTVGEFAKIDTNWNGMPMSYYVEEAYRDDAVAIFGNTPQMLTFFSERLGLKYPWEKYSQIVARDYVSGAMENTTANLYFSAIQRTTKELEDYDYETIIAHELFHQWFGDLVTCESWSNLPLNESFANYGEYLWIEHKYGNYEAEKHRMSELSGYLGEAKVTPKKLIRFYYEDKEDMFDAHSYNKGGLILNMLRDYLGDDAFFAALELYLNENQYTAAEYPQLRMAFEEVTGQDLNWFFNQWFLSAGHPALVIEKSFNEPRKKVTITVKQVQEGEDIPSVFRLPFYIDIYENGKVRREHVVMEEREQSFTFQYDQKPDLINVDATKTMLSVKQEEKSMEEWIFQYRNAPLYVDKREALNALMNGYIDSLAAVRTLQDALQHEYYGIRKFVIDRIPLDGTVPNVDNLKAYMIQIAKGDKDNGTAASAVNRLATLEDVNYTKVFEDLTNEARSYIVTAAALEGLFAIDPRAAYKVANNKFDKEMNADVATTVASIYAYNGFPENQEFFERMIPASIGYSKYSFISDYGDLLAQLDPSYIRKGIPTLVTFAKHSEPWWNRYGATASIHTIMTELREQITVINAQVNNGDTPNSLAQGETKPLEDLLEELEVILADIKATEKSESLQRRYKNFE